MTNAKPIEELNDAELYTAVYGENVVPSAAMIPIQTPEWRENMRNRLRQQISAELLNIDTLSLPYNVPCPVCLAFALGPCMNMPRVPCEEHPYMKFPTAARVIGDPHNERWSHYHEHPEFRVQATRG